MARISKRHALIVEMIRVAFYKRFVRNSHAELRKEVRNTRRALKKKGMISMKDIDNDISSSES